MSTTTYPPTPASTPCPEDTSVFFGWYSEAAQALRIASQPEHYHNGKSIKSPPYCYWIRGDNKILVTEVTHTSVPTMRQVKNGDMCVGQVDKYFGRTYSRL